MSAGSAGEGRGRPLSGVWSLLGWLRREDRASSDDSLSSGTSARTAASFAYLQPAAYPAAAPATRPHPSPPSDTYRKRVRAGDQRRQYERHLTLHRKYLLPLGEVQYDALTLPPARRDPSRDRVRRAASESLPRRLAHVPGKRRAPPPPRAASTLRRTAKRPAPQPPALRSNTSVTRPSSEVLNVDKENLESKMSSKPIPEERSSKNGEKPTDCKSEKCRKDSSLKPRQEKSFLKQIFENRKRNSVIDVTTVKLLPSISELDKQAAELLKSYKLKAFEQNNNVSMPGSSASDVRSSEAGAGNMWFCTRCLKKYDATMVTCLDCLSEAKVYSDSSAFKDSCLALKRSENERPASWNSAMTSNDLSEKQKLKEMLKEMKDSLPKRQKPDKNVVAKNGYTFNKPQTLEDKINQNKETPTLPIGSKIPNDVKFEHQPSSSKQNGKVTIADFLNKDKASPQLERTKRLTETVVITQTTVLVDSTPKLSSVVDVQPQHAKIDSRATKSESIDKKVKCESLKDAPRENTVVVTDNINRIHQPMKISSLLNPIYIPKSSAILHNAVATENSTSAQVFKDGMASATSPRPGPSAVTPTVQPTSSDIPSELQEIKPDTITKSETTQSTNVHSSPDIKKRENMSVKTTEKTTEVNGKVYDLKPLKDLLRKTTEEVPLSNKNIKEVPLTKKNIEETCYKQNTPETNPIMVKSDISVNKTPKITTETYSQASTSKSVVTATETPASKLDIAEHAETANALQSETTKSNDGRLSSEKLSNALQSETTKSNNGRLSSEQPSNALQSETTKSNIGRLSSEQLSNALQSGITKSNIGRLSSEQLSNALQSETNKSNNSRLSSEQLSNALQSETTKSNNGRLSSEQLSKRRDLVNLLEKSIAKGDERAAAEAAIRLAQLRLSCSVLTFSSHIIAEAMPSTSSNKVNTETQSSSSKIYEPPTKSSSKVDSATQSEGTRCSKAISVSTKLVDINKRTVESSNSKSTVTSKETVFPPKERIDTNVAATKVSTVEASTSKVEIGDLFTISVWVEDRVAARGPVRLRVARSARLATLRRQAEETLGLPARLQRWIVGRALCCDDNALLSTLAGPFLEAPFYLCLVESDAKPEPSVDTCVVDAKSSVARPTPALEDQTGQVYSELVQLEMRALVPNTEQFECAVCLDECEAGAGVVLRECVHAFCRDCLLAAVRHCEEAAVRCPAAECGGALQEREVRALVPTEDYERWLARSLAAAESGARHAFHCRTRDCAGWALCEPGVQRFPCPVCTQTNCVPCQAIHESETCEQHRTRLREAAAAVGSQHADEGTRALLESLIARGEALECPECSAVITKKWGCDWVRCSACKTEICWVTRGRRWGPQGKGDTSAGCRCGVDGKRCHPSCGYCH